METRLHWAIVLLGLALGPGAAAQGTRGGPTVSTGHILDTSPEAGALMIYSLEIRRPVVFRGLQCARLETASGLPAPWSALVPEMPVTVYHARRDGRWRVEKVTIPDAQPLPVLRPRTTLTGAESRALRSEAFNDGDITTNPGVRARIDNDITTNPGKKDPDDPDITRRINN